MTADNDHLAGSVLRIKAPPGKPGQPIQAWLKHKLLPPILPDLESFFCLKLGVFENGAEGEEGGKPLGLGERHRVDVPRHLKTDNRQEAGSARRQGGTGGGWGLEFKICRRGSRELGFRIQNLSSMVKGSNLLQIREYVNLLPGALETAPKSNRGRLEGPTKVGRHDDALALGTGENLEAPGVRFRV